ncbi:MAG: hypothetical protein ACR2JM_08100 [Mycobacterium sp.]
MTRMRLGRPLAVAAGAVLAMAVPVVTSPPASACPSGFSVDPYSGQCLTPNALPTVSGIPCIPGKSLGTCLGILQNQSPPGGGPPPGGLWP